MISSGWYFRRMAAKPPPKPGSAKPLAAASPARPASAAKPAASTPKPGSALKPPEIQVKAAAEQQPEPVTAGSAKDLPVPKLQTKHVDARVAARTSALNVIGGVKVDVFVRVRPRVAQVPNPTWAHLALIAPRFQEAGDEQCVTVDHQSNTIQLKSEGKEQTFTYDRVYGQDASQEELFKDAVVPIVDQVSRGMACAVLAYGQTGAGKTYTMVGASHKRNACSPLAARRSLRRPF